ncbi:MAG: hypothetical protein LBE34_01940 [Flavobacteriaceae bacterium]|nr:hypothetical protein [Flavobacteriaceae bacterium]
MRGLISVFLILSSLFSMAQVGVGIEDPKAAVHIGKDVRLKDVRNVEGSMEAYPKHLIADEKGNLAVFTGLPTDLVFKNVVTTKMNNIVNIPNDNTKDRNVEYEEASLELSTKIVVPAHKTYVLEVTYSIPSMHPFSGTPKGEFGVFVKKKQGNTEFEKIKKSVRSFSTSYKNANTTTANGRAIGYTYVDTVENNTDKPLEVIYDLYGFTNRINLRNYSIRFGTYTDNSNNYNWGKGLVLVTINELIK